MQRPRILQNSKGFTLVEAMVVVIIIAVMAGFSYSGFTARQKREQLRSAAMLLTEYLREAKMSAIEKSTPVVCAFGGTTTYTTFIDKNGDFAYTAGTDTLIHQVDLTSEYPGVAFSSTPAFALTFGDPTKRIGMPKITAGALPANLTLKEDYRGHTYSCTVRVSSVGMIDVVKCAAGDTYCMDLGYK